MTSVSRIYADAAAATPLSPAAEAEIIRLLPLYGNPGALHKEAVAAKTELDQARSRIAEVIGAHQDEIVLTASGTEANNLALQGVLRPQLSAYGELGAITSAIEHPSVLEPLMALERDGLYVTELVVDEAGMVSPEMLAQSINDQTAIVSIQWVNSEIGSVQDIRALAKVVRHARRARVEAMGEDALPLLFHCDASQAALWYEIKVDHLGIDLLTLDAQKVMGPKGVGALYVRRGVDLVPVIYGGTQEHGLRAGTPNLPLVGSFSVALRDAQSEVTSTSNRVGVLREQLWRRLEASLTPCPLLNGPSLIDRVPNNLNISIPGIDGDTAVIALDAQGVAASVRSACKTSADLPSHVLAAIGLPRARALSSFRLTLLPTVSDDDVMHIAKALEHVAMRYKTIV